MRFLDLIADTRVMQLITCVVASTLAIILLLIKIPLTPHTKKLGNAKNVIAMSFLVCGFMMVFSIIQYSKVTNYDVFASITMLVVVSLSSMAISYAMINILDEQRVPTSTYVLYLFLLGVCFVMLIESTLSDRPAKAAFLAIGLVLFSIECIFLIIKFDKAFKKCLRELNAYYDDDENYKIRWIRFCYIIAMLTNMFFLVYMVIPHQFMKLYMAWYIVFMLYFTANLISFIGNHQVVLDAVAHKTLAIGSRFQPRQLRHKKQTPIIDQKQRDKEFRTLATNIEKWVEERKYREYDKTRDQTAVELDTTKEVLQLYFATVVGKDFRSWRTELRIEDAKQMLLVDRKASIQIVGETCGFSDRSNFHTTFTKAVGCSPREWRDKNGKPGNN